MVRDKVISVEKQDERILSVQTAEGKKFSAAWFIDASGSGTSLLARSFNISAVQYGPAKVALWNYYPVTQGIEGTTLYMDPSPTTTSSGSGRFPSIPLRSASDSPRQEWL